jgi:thymidylate synthase (FAD)
MKVKLVSYSQPPAEDKTILDNDLLQLVAYCARVSNPSNQNNKETAEKLVKYLMKHKHWSPLEMVSLCLEVETTRDIARQFLRHRSFTFQEFSQRYADPTKDLDFVLRDCRLQDTKNRQNSIDVDMKDEYQGGLADRWSMMQQRVIDEACLAYNWAIDNGIAKEQARSVLPEGNTMSRMYVSGTLRSWLHYIEVRSGNGTQKEHMELAKAVAEVIAKVFPLSNHSD